MKPKFSIITLAVKDLDVAYAFYHDGLGITGDVSRNDEHIAIGIDSDLSLALYSQDAFNKIAGQTHFDSYFAGTCISHTAESATEVDEILQKAKAAGGTLPIEPKDYDWGYSGYFKDLDGHLWEVVYFKQ